MTTSKVDRRGVVRLAGIGAGATLLGGVSTTPAVAYQGNMERALSSLFQALASLRESTPNKGGHRANAMRLVQQAIEETQAGVEFADERGGGGQQ